MPSICQGTWDCQICPKAVSNAITHVIYQRGFHKPAQINPEKPDVPLNKNDAFQKVQKRRVQEKR